MEDSKSRRKLQVHRKRKTPFEFNNLTDELLHEILIRLESSKEAIRCKLVCKRWFSLISSDYFVTASAIHHRVSDETLLPFALVTHDRNKLEYVEFLHAKGLSSRTVDLGFLNAGQPNDQSVSLQASCGDLILLSSNQSFYYYICNILTRQWISLPPAPSGRGRFGESVGFLYEPLDNNDRRNKYLVLRFIPRGWYYHEGDSRFDVQIFSSEKGRWTRSVVMSPRILNRSRSKTSIIACERMLYTLNYVNSVTVNCIVAFDPFTDDPAQLLHVIDLPLDARDIRCVAGKLGVCRGRLRFAHLICQQIRYPCIISVWELEDYRMGKWTLVHKRIPMNKALRTRLLRCGIRNMVSVLAFHPYNEDLIYFLISNDLVVAYNIRTDKVESSVRSSLFVLQNPPTLLVPGVLPITQQWWPTPVRPSL